MTEHTVEDHEKNVAKAQAALDAAKAKAAYQEYPKFVDVHPSHVVRTGDHVSVPNFSHHHVDRDGAVTVWVKDAEEEAKALAAAVKGAL